LDFDTTRDNRIDGSDRKARPGTSAGRAERTGQEGPFYTARTDRPSPILKGKLVVVEGSLAGTGRTALERLGAEVEEIKLEDEKRYIDMTPAIFVFAAIAMAVRYISLGLDDQDLYILAGIFFALMYGLKPFFFKMQRPRDQ